ncbi:MAG: metallophosphoesterase, partial [Bellilinea sp.]
MKIAITADTHLTTSEKHPERFHAIENILDQLVEQEITTLIIAGDLFDATCTTPGEFEDIIKKKKYLKIKLFIIPGNHDPVISDGTFSLQNVEYISKPRLIRIDDSIPFI